MDLPIRPRRNRKSNAVRQAIAETHLSKDHLVYPMFVSEGDSVYEEIKTMPGQFRLGQKKALSLAQEAWKNGIRSFAIFPVVPDSQKDKKASKAVDPNHFLLRFFTEFKNLLPEATLISDVALDPFSSDGHDGLVENGIILNDASVEVLAKMAALHARAGADFVAPSDMMDGRVAAIRQILDDQGFENTGIISYSAKYASAFYGPFRDALSSAPKSGDKKTYQMDPRNSREALREVSLDIAEGADMVMVKPASAYLDIIRSVREISDVPVAAYNVSGEYAMIKFAALAGGIDEKAAVLESMTAIRRAGADLIFTYWALDLARWL